MLEGIRIIEVEGLGAAPFAGMLLADLGADVIVVHRPTSSPGELTTEQSVIDRGKRSIVLNLKQADDLHIFKQLLGTADALIEGFRPGVMERLGIGPSDCFKLNKKLVYGRMTGWGQHGEQSQTAGHDLNFIAMSGAAWYSSASGNPPQPPPTLVGDSGGGALYLVVGVLSALIKARQTGTGCTVDAAIVDGSAHLMNLLMSLRQAGVMQTERGQSVLDGPHFSRTYETADAGYMSVQCIEPAFYAVFLGKLGLATDQAFLDQYNKSLWPDLTHRLSAVFLSKTRKEWEAVFANSDACVAPVLNPEEAFDHPYNKVRETWIKPQGLLQARAAPRFSTEDHWQPSPGPKRDQHRQDILEELKINNKET